MGSRYSFELTTKVLSKSAGVFVGKGGGWGIHRSFLISRDPRLDSKWVVYFCHPREGQRLDGGHKDLL